MENLCLKSGQVTVCAKEDGVTFTVKPLLGEAKTKVILYSDILDIKIGPKWWVFPGFRIITKDENKIFVEFDNYKGFNLKNNQVTFYIWQYKSWGILFIFIKEK